MTAQIFLIAPAEADAPNLYAIAGRGACRVHGWRRCCCRAAHAARAATRRWSRPEPRAQAAGVAVLIEGELAGADAGRRWPSMSRAVRARSRRRRRR